MLVFLDCKGKGPKPLTRQNQGATVILPYAAWLLFNKNELFVSYLQPKFTNVSIECVIDSRKRKQWKTTSRGLV